jgi:WD40 repeat protein
MSDGGRKGKTAVVFVHGQGEHVPLGSAPELARTVCATDPDVPADSSGSSKVRLSSDASISDEETPRASVPCKSSVEFFEYYWSDMMTGNQFAHVWRWFRNLIRKTAEQTPSRILPARQLFIRTAEIGGVFVAAFTLFTVSVSILLADAAKVSAQDFFDAACWSTGGAAPSGWPEGVTNLDPNPLADPRSYDDMLFTIRQDTAAIRSGLGMGPSGYQDQGLCLAPSVGAELFDRPQQDRLELLPSEQRVVRAGCATLDRDARANARRVVACLDWNAQAPDELEADVLTTAFDATGTRLATAHSDAKVRVWDATLYDTPELDFDDPQPLLTLDHPQVYAAAYSPNPAIPRLISWGYDGNLRLWNSDTGEQIVAKSIVEGIYGAAFAEGGRRVLVWDGSGTAWVLDATTGADVSRLRQDTSVWGAAISSNGERVLTWDDRVVRVWDAAKGGEVTRHVHESGVYGAAFPADSSARVLSWDFAGARVWSADNGTTTIAEMTPPAGLASVSISPDGSLVLTTSYEQSATLWTAARNAPDPRVLAHEGAVYWAEFSRDGRFVVTASEDIDFATQQGYLKVWDAASGALTADGPTHTSFVYDAALSRDGSSVLSWDSTTAIVWDIATGREFGRRVHPEGLSMASFTPDGARVVSSSGVGTAQVWDQVGGLLFDLGAGRATKIAREALANVRSSMRPARAAADGGASGAGPGGFTQAGDFGFSPVAQTDFQAARTPDTVAPAASAFRYLIAWVRASASESHERGAFRAVLLAPVAIGALILFVIFADWLGLARRGAAESPSLVRQRFARSPTWLYFLVMFFAPWALIAVYGYISSETGWRSDVELITWFVIATAILGGASIGALTMIARHLLDAHALRALGPLPARRRTWRTKLRAWTMLVWVPLWLLPGLLPIAPLLGVSTPVWPLLFYLLPIVIAVVVFFFRARRLRRQKDLERWPFPWHLVQLFLFALGASTAGGVVASSAFSGLTATSSLLFTLGGFAAILFVLCLTTYLSDDRGGPIRHLVFGVVGAAYATVVVWLGIEVAAALPRLGVAIDESGRQAALVLCAIVALALALHLLRTALTRAQRSRIMRAVVLPTAVVGGFLYFVYWTVTYLGGQFAEERTIESANEEIEATLALQNVADDSRLASSVRLVEALRRSDELQFLAIRTIFEVRSAFPAVPLERPAPPPSAVYNGATFSSDGVRVLTWGGDDESRIWDAYSGAVLARHEGSSGLFGATFTANGSRVLAWDYTGAYIWDAGTGLDLARFPHNTAFNAIIHEGADRVLTWGDDNTVRAWDATTGAPLGMMTHEYATLGAAFSPDGGLVLSWDGGGDALVWEAETGLETARRFDALGVYSAAFSPDGGRVLSLDGEGSASVWDVQSGLEIARQTHDLGVFGAVFSPDGSRVLSWGGDSDVRVWDAATGVVLARQTHDSGAYGAAFSPDGSRVLSWAYGDARIWDPATGAELARYTHEYGILSASFDPYGVIVLTVGDDNDVRLWSALDTGEQLLRLPHDSTVYGAQINAYGDRLLTWDASGGARVWDAFADAATSTPVRLAVASGGAPADAAPQLRIACDDLIQDYVAYARCIDDLIFSEQSLVLEDLADGGGAFELAALADPFATAADGSSALDTEAARERETYIRGVESEFFTAFLFELKNALASYSNVGVLQVALIWAGFTILALIWARMLVASLVVAVAVAPLGLLTALGNNVELRLLNVENRLAPDAVLALGESPLRLVNGAYGFFLAFCLAWFVVQILRELFDLRRVRGLPHLALALAAAFGVAAYNAGGTGQDFGALAASRGFPLALTWAAVVVAVLGFATWIVVQILRELGARSWIARGLPVVLALGVVAAGWYSYDALKPDPATLQYPGINLTTGGIASVEEIWTVSVVVVLMVVIGGMLYAAQLFLVPIMADSARYLSPKPQNIARRREIVDRGVRLLRAITASGRYDRIVIVAHSLGTLVAFDALNRWWSHFEENVRREDLRAPRAAVATAAAELSDGVCRGLVSIAESLAVVVERRRRGARGAKAEASRAADARTDEKRVERVCELLGGLAAVYEKAGGSRKASHTRSGDAAKPERAVRGRAARARAGEALNDAMRALRAGPASFGKAAESLREAARHVRSVFGADPKSADGKGLRRRLPASAAATADALDEAGDQLGGIARLHDQHLAAQERLAAVLASGPADQRFIVTDLVTLGSPLTHGEYLIGADHRVQTAREDVVAGSRPIDALEQRLAVESPAGAQGSASRAAAGDDGSTFPGVRWTNLYFRGPNLLKGDIVGGPVWPVFGAEVIDVPLDQRPNKSAFAHNEYWKCSLEDAALIEQGAPEHIRALRAALRLVPPVPR